ncbi:MAG: Asp-tRNA(Asn)/Glu-tRNA(Gln) amidotransferase subunit GatC [Nitrospiraceae bacterium]|nr:Asp-tRNA(Asn)/Glu-tRNA(Gln) amidotransferase subunit GatC [Nitrospiraceae bacterium]MDA8261819.1 Asp-tRNA(Asn)/Glu-tRNA(Gln) amidotransferase subunit GatC [Actinomycetota bacterium]
MSSDQISRDETLHIAHLARLAITDEEAAIYASQLSAVLAHARDIGALDIAGVEPTMHAVSMRNVMREDVVEGSLDRDEVLASAPSSEAGMFVVPRIVGED